MTHITEFIRKNIFGVIGGCLIVLTLLMVPMVLSYINIKKINDEYKYYTLPNGIVIKYQGAVLVPDVSGNIVIPKKGATLILPEDN